MCSSEKINCSNRRDDKLFLRKDDKNVLLSTVTSSGRATLVARLTSTLDSGSSNSNTAQCLTGQDML